MTADERFKACQRGAQEAACFWEAVQLQRSKLTAGCNNRASQRHRRGRNRGILQTSGTRGSHSCHSGSAAMPVARSLSAVDGFQWSPANCWGVSSGAGTGVSRWAVQCGWRSEAQMVWAGFLLFVTVTWQTHRGPFPNKTKCFQGI